MYHFEIYICIILKIVGHPNIANLFIFVSCAREFLLCRGSVLISNRFVGRVQVRLNYVTRDWLLRGRSLGGESETKACA